MCSASSRITRSRMSRLTSTSSRSAPLPPRSTRIACSWSSAWVTEAPLSMAILVAVVSWPFNVPTMRSRMSISCSSVRAGHARSVQVGKRNLGVGVAHGFVLIALGSLLLGRHVAPNEFVDPGFNGGALLHDTAVGPFDPAIAGRDFRLGEYHQTALEAALRRKPLDLLARGLVQGRVDPHHQMRRRYKLREAIADEAGDLAKRLGGDQLAA